MSRILIEGWSFPEFIVPRNIDWKEDTLPVYVESLEQWKRGLKKISRMQAEEIAQFCVVFKQLSELAPDNGEKTLVSLLLPDLDILQHGIGHFIYNNLNFSMLEALVYALHWRCEKYCSLMTKIAELLGLEASVVLTSESIIHRTLFDDRLEALLERCAPEDAVVQALMENDESHDTLFDLIHTQLKNTKLRGFKGRPTATRARPDNEKHPLANIENVVVMFDLTEAMTEHVGPALQENLEPKLTCLDRTRAHYRIAVKDRVDTLVMSSTVTDSEEVPVMMMPTFEALDGLSFSQGDVITGDVDLDAAFWEVLDQAHLMPSIWAAPGGPALLSPGVVSSDTGFDEDDFHGQKPSQTS